MQENILTGASTINLSTAFWVFWLIVLVAYIVASAILEYHWRSYAHDDTAMKKARWWYYGVAFVIFALTALIINTL